MEGTRTPQESVALRDVAYVIRYGHFPCDDEAPTSNHTAASPSSLPPPSLPPSSAPPPSLPPSSAPPPSLPPSSASPTSLPPPSALSLSLPPPSASPSPSLPPLPASPSSPLPSSPSPASSPDDLNPFESDPNPFSEEQDQYIDDTNTFAEDLNPLGEEKSSPGHESPPESSTLVPVTPTTPAPGPTTPPKAGVKGEVEGGVSRRLVKKMVAEVFNLTQLDMRRMVEEVDKSKEAPSVKLLLEEMKTSGLGLEPTTGSCSPPVVFVRAMVGEQSEFTSFTSTSATRATHNTLTLDVCNMYTDTLTLQIWQASAPSVVEPPSAPMLDILSRLITSATRHQRDNASHARNNGEATSPVDAKKGLPGDTRAGEISVTPRKNSIDTPRKGSGDSNVTPSKDSSNSNFTPSEGSSDKKVSETGPTESTPNKAEPGVGLDMADGPLDTADAVSVVSDVSPEDPRTSTPHGLSTSFQTLELSGLEAKKSKSHKGSNTKLSVSNLKSSLRASFRRSHNNLSKATSSSKLSDSYLSTTENTKVTTDTSEGNERVVKNGGDERDGIAPQKDKGDGRGKLNRQRSGSLLSVKSFSRINFGSLRFSSQKASDIMKRIGNKKGKKSQSVTSTPRPNRKEFLDDNVSISSLESDIKIEDEKIEPPPPAVENHVVRDEIPEVQHNDEALDVTPMTSADLRISFKQMFSTPRRLRTYKSFRDKGSSRKHDLKYSESLAYSGDAKPERERINIKPEGESASIQDRTLNPDDVHKYLTVLGKSHLKAELVAYLSIPIKSLVGTWKKEAWLPLKIVQEDKSSSSQKKKKSSKGAVCGLSLSQRAGNVMCKFHVCLTLPTPETELTNSGYDTYSISLHKLVEAKVQTLKSMQDYKGEVEAAGDVLLQQLVFFSRVSEHHRNLAKWLVLVEVKPSDPFLLLPLLQAIKVHLEAGLYLTLQKRELSGALAMWVRKVLTDEFEMLHSSFPTHNNLLELARLEHFLRCFNTVDACYELRVLFEREVAVLGLACLTDLLQAALTKHADTWVEALNKEPLVEVSASSGSSSNSSSSSTAPAEWHSWQEAQRRASLLTQPILDFLTISFFTYQPIFMVELSVDYLYMVMPKMVKAAVHLINPLLKYDVDGSDQVPPEALPAAAQSAWLLLSTLSSINKIGIDSRLPQHLIPQEYRDAFSVVLLHWLALSKHLALLEFNKDIEEDQFVAVDDLEGHSQSAVGVADLMKAMMDRAGGGLKWPGGVGPRGATLTKMGQQMMELADRYTEMVTRAYVDLGDQTNTISTQACVVMRNVEHVCDQVKTHLMSLAELATDQEVKHQLEERTHHLQEHMDDAAEILVRQCLPSVEQLLTQGVRQGSWEHVLNGLQAVVRPVEDRLYFAEPLMQQLWFRLFQHAKNLMDTYVKGEWRDNLRQLRTVLDHTHSFLTSQDHVGLILPEVVTKEYQAVQAELTILGATSAELMSQFYQERYKEQQREDTNTSRILIVNAAFTETGLRVHVVQTPGVMPNGVLVKVRLEPQQWFPTSEPHKTRVAKDNPAVFNEVIEFCGVGRGYGEDGVGGMLTMQVRTPKFLSNTTVHHEAILPLSLVPHASQDEVLRLPHTRLPLTRPWKLASYKPLEALTTRALDKSAADFLKALSERWEPNESSVQIKDSQKLASFVRAGSIRSSMKASRKASLRGALVK